MKNLIRFACALLPLAAVANEKPAASKPAPQHAALPAHVLAAPTAERLAPMASVPVTPTTSANSLAAPSSIPAAPAAIAATAGSFASKTVVKAKREGFLKRTFKKMKQQLNTYVLVGLIVVGIGLLVALVGAEVLGILFIIGGGVLIILGVV